MGWKDKLKNRTQRSAETREQRNLGRKSVLDLGALGLPSWTPKTGSGNKNYIDILPWKITQPWYRNLKTVSGELTRLDIGDRDYKLEISRHGSVGPNNDLFLCLREAFGNKDVICEEMFDEYAKRNDTTKNFDKDRARSLQPSWRDFYIIYDYDDGDKGFQLWEMAFTNFEKFLLEQISNHADGQIIFWDLEEGRSLEFGCREKELGKAKWPELNGDITFHERDEPYKDSVIDEIPSLDAAVTIPSYDDISNAFYGMEGDDTSNDQESEDKPSSSQSRSRPSTRERASTPVEEKPTPKEESTPTRSRNRPEPAQEEEELPAWDTTKCAQGGEFGKDCNSLKECDYCPEDVYKVCEETHEKLSKQSAKEPEPEPEVETEPETTTRIRKRRR